MQVQNIGFGAIKAGAIRKGMILRKNSGYKEGSEKIVINKEKLFGNEVRLTFKWSDDHRGSDTFQQTYKKEQMINNFDLVGWAKKKSKW